VKLFHEDLRFEDTEFENEFTNLKTRINHPNIIRLVGYCFNSHFKLEYKGMLRWSWSAKTHRILCSEYLHGGSLDKYLKGKMPSSFKLFLLCLRETDSFISHLSHAFLVLLVLKTLVNMTGGPVSR
jgi:serine/threonine protein kinase